MEDPSDIINSAKHNLKRKGHKLYGSTKCANITLPSGDGSAKISNVNNGA